MSDETKTSKRLRSRRLHVERLEERALLSADLAFGVAETIPPPTVRYHVELTDSANRPLSEINLGEQFFARVFVTDLRTNPQGVFAGFAGLDFNRRSVLRSSSVALGDDFSEFRHYSNSTAMGGMASSLTPPGHGTSLLATVPLLATASGAFSFDPTPATGSMAFDTLLYGWNDSIPPSAIQFTGASLQVRPGQFTIVDAPGTLLGDAANSQIDSQMPLQYAASFSATDNSTPRSLATDLLTTEIFDLDSAVKPKESRQLLRDSGEPWWSPSRQEDGLWRHLSRELPRRDPAQPAHADPGAAVPTEADPSTKLHALRGTWDHGLRSLSRIRDEFRTEPFARRESGTRDFAEPRVSKSEPAPRTKILRKHAFLAIGRDSLVESTRRPQVANRSAGEATLLVDLSSAVHESIWSDLEQLDASQAAAEQLANATHEQKAASPEMIDSLFVAGVEVESRVRPLSRIEFIVPSSSPSATADATPQRPAEANAGSIDSRRPSVTQLPETSAVPAA